VKTAIPNDRKAAIEKRGEAARTRLRRGHGAHARGGGGRLEREPDQHRAHVHGGVRSGEGPRLVPRRLRRQRQQLAEPPVAAGEYHHWLGRSGGYGVGYGAPASVGAALANRDLGRFSVSIQSDGDLMYAPGVLWTAPSTRFRCSR